MMAGAEERRVRTPRQYLEGLRDGREVWYWGQRVPDVTAHPELGIAARHGAHALRPRAGGSSPAQVPRRSFGRLRSVRSTTPSN